MTTAHKVNLSAYRSGTVSVAGVPWPIYKLMALAVGLLVLLIVGVATMSASSAVLGAAAATSAVWLGFSLFHPDH